MRVKDKTILVTGATGGIGSALCSLLAKRGARLILTCYNDELLAWLKAKLGSGHTTVTADISSNQGRKEIVTACTRNGGIDAVINLAGILDFNLFEKQSEETIDKILSINLVSVMLLCHELIPMLREKPTAAIANIGSTFGSIGHPGFAAYCASKAGVRCFTEALSRELADSDIHVSYIAPRATSTSLNTDQINALNTALGNKSDSPEYVADQIVEVIEQDAWLRFLGWPEKLFVRVNALCPGLVHGALVKKLSVIKQYANQ
ncbi:MAG: SDR family oxidoreductase [Gammaproteobacteria bacterium]|jgi:short-subunit dehydrogenase|nr:SDR family oxidoreductase [Gammaproteobacteria bacterium]|tara:strand:- start:1242 stop:2027 length:786 start_codon:yes stop_codon:yes gene_type:complete